MKVPKIALGVAVLVDGKVWSVDGINLHDQRFSVTNAYHDKRGMPLPDGYNPVPNWENFIKAIDQWDYYYAASDSDIRVTEGLEMEKALKRLFKELSKEDQHRLQKIVGIVVHV